VGHAGWVARRAKAACGRRCNGADPLARASTSPAVLCDLHRLGCTSCTAGDLNETFVVGEVDEESKKLLRVTHDVRHRCAALCCASHAVLR
jgi:hypothetical protein